jgi:predicted signal transduction protein with EAL and GGDEF domain
MELAVLLALLLFCVKGWERHVRDSTRARIATETAAVYECLAHEDALTGLPNRRRGRLRRTAGRRRVRGRALRPR